MASGSKSPFPTQDQILEFVRTSAGPVGKREIGRAFRLDATQKMELKKVLKAMQDEGLLDKGRGHRVAQAGTLPNVAVIEISGVDLDGEVMARPIDWDPDDGDPPAIYLEPGRDMGTAPGVGERILARLERAADGYNARVIRRIAAAPEDVLGILIEVEGELRIRPVDKKQRNEYVVPPADAKDARPGDLVRAQSVRGRRLGLRRARVLERISESEGSAAISLISIHQYGIPVEYPTEARHQAEHAKAAPLGKRDDLRSIPLVTIDGADARDFDDAVYAEPDDDPKNEGGYKLLVAIADVAWYVRPSDPLDRAAFERGNSVYFPDRVVPMLPEELSNGWCSLRPNEDRPCLVAHLQIDKWGTLLSKRFKRAMMRSAARLTYEQVQAASDGNPDDTTGPLMDPVIRPLYGAYDILLKAREERGALEIDMPERVVRLDEHGEVLGIEPRQRLDSHKLIEEFMVLANVAAAEYLEETRRPCMYRIHDQPSLAKLEALGEFLESLGIRFAKGQAVTPARFNQVLARVAETRHQHMVNEVVLRSQAQAQYSPDNIGHFGLALRRYCHFTSPIRRYSDLLVHRALIRGMSPNDGALGEDPGDFGKIGEHLCTTERRAQAAERDAADRYAAHFMGDRVGATFHGRVNGVTRFGLFITLDDIGADGLIPIKTLPADYYDHDEDKHMLVGRATGTAFRLGDRLEVMLKEASPITGGMIFALRGGGSPSGRGGPPHGKGGRAGKPQHRGRKRADKRAVKRAKRDRKQKKS